MTQAACVLVAWVVCAPLLALFVADAIRIADARTPDASPDEGGVSW